MNIDAEITQVGYEIPPVVKKITEELLCSYSNRYPGIYIKTIHTDADAARQWGFKDMVLQGSQTMNFGSEALFKVYREGWINDSSFTVKFIKPVINGETVTTKGVVSDREDVEGGKIRLKIDVWSENLAGDEVMVGEATITL